jgi:hypothetical protein
MGAGESKFLINNKHTTAKLTARARWKIIHILHGDRKIGQWKIGQYRE